MEKMLGKATRREVQECLYGCCLPRGYVSDRKPFKRRQKRRERQAWKREVFAA